LHTYTQGSIDDVVWAQLESKLLVLGETLNGDRALSFDAAVVDAGASASSLSSSSSSSSAAANSHSSIRAHFRPTPPAPLQTPPAVTPPLFAPPSASYSNSGGNGDYRDVNRGGIFNARRGGANPFS
jgi:hypothetical protein